MVGEATKLRSEELNLNLCFEKLMMLGDGFGGKTGGVKMEGVVITEWKDIPMELLLRIGSLVDDRTIIMASGVPLHLSTACIAKEPFFVFCWNFGGTYFQGFLRDFSGSINLLFLHRRIHRICLYILSFSMV
ncbi:hypothetical protein Q3G72_009503 [Acer saccharum]|nr:hypothetical protein Q3G72_009503 [Acer saccharum]